MDGVQHDHPLDDVRGEVDELSVAVVAAPDLERTAAARGSGVLR